MVPQADSILIKLWLGAIECLKLLRVLREIVNGVAGLLLFHRAQRFTYCRNLRSTRNGLDVHEWQCTGLHNTVRRRCNVNAMKRLQIMIARARTTKLALIRRYVRKRLRPLPPIEEDPLWELVGMAEGSPDDSRSVDDVVYGPKRAD